MWKFGFPETRTILDLGLLALAEASQFLDRWSPSPHQPLKVECYEMKCDDGDKDKIGKKMNGQ